MVSLCIRLFAYWLIGLLVCRFVCLSVYWLIAVLVDLRIGLLVYLRVG